MVLHTRSVKTKEYIWVRAKHNPEFSDYEEDFYASLRSTVAKKDMEGAIGPRLKLFLRSTVSFLRSFSKEGKGLLALRTTIEQNISCLKQGLKMKSLRKRGKKNVIAHVAKCLLSMHIVANVVHKIDHQETMHRIKTFSA